MSKETLIESAKLHKAVNKLGINFDGLSYGIYYRFGLDFCFGGSTGIDPQPKSDYFFHDLSHIVEYSIKEFRERTMKSGQLVFKAPWNNYFNCSEGFSTLSATLREARTIAIEMHLFEMVGYSVDYEKFVKESATSVVRFVGDAHHLTVDLQEDLGQKDLEKRRIDKLTLKILDYYNEQRKDIIAQRLKERMKAISLYAQKARAKKKQ